MDKKYCNVCGEKLAPVPTGTFDTSTGKEINIMVCPTGICYHTNVKHQYKVKWFGREGRCVRCEARPLEYYPD